MYRAPINTYKYRCSYEGSSYKEKNIYIKTTIPIKVNVGLPINIGVFIACRSGHFDLNAYFQVLLLIHKSKFWGRTLR